jgi:exocyst complex protein 7
MEGISMKKAVIERKLEQTDEKIEELEQSLKRSDELAKSMCGILESFNERLKKLEDTIKPIHDETTRLKRLQGNVDKTMNAIDRVLALHKLPEEVEEQIRDGERVNICGVQGSVERYLKIMDQLKNAIDFFEKSNIHSMEASTARTLYDTGLKALARDFRSQLQRNSDPVPISMLLDLVDLPVNEDPPTLETLNERLIQDLAAVARYLTVWGKDKDFLSVYAQLRSSQMTKSMNQLKDSPQFADIIPPHHRRNATLTRMANQVLMKMDSPAKIKMAKKEKPKPVAKSSSSMALLRGEGQEGESENSQLFVVMTNVFVRLMQSEHSLMIAIIPGSHQDEVFDRLTKETFDQYMRRGEELHQRSKREISRQNYLVVLSVCKVIRDMRALEPLYCRLMAELPSRCFNRYPILTSSLQTMTAKALSDFVIFVKSDPEKQSQLPRDGTVHEFTSNVMAYLEQLLLFHDVVGWCLSQAKEKRSDVSERELRRILGQYLRSGTDALKDNLEAKSKGYDSPTLQALFLLNNFFFLHSVFQRNEEMMKLLEVHDSQVEGHYIKAVEDQISNYQRGFNRLTGHLSTNVAIVALAQPDKADKLSKNQRQMIKDRFKGFNTEMEELTRIQRTYSIPDETLRGRVKMANVELLVPVYREFYDRFSKVGFTQNQDKYLKYTPERLEQTLLTFFDATA